MDSKLPIFISIVIIFLPLLFFAGDNDIFLIASFIILLVISIDNILFSLKSSKDAKLKKELDKLRSDVEGKSLLNLDRLEMGFKTAKTIFITTFVVSILIIFKNNLPIMFMSVIVLFLSVIELRHYNHDKKRHFSFISSIINIVYLITVAVTRYMA